MGRKRSYIPAVAYLCCSVADHLEMGFPCLVGGETGLPKEPDVRKGTNSHHLQGGLRIGHPELECLHELRAISQLHVGDAFRCPVPWKAWSKTEDMAVTP